MSKTKQRKLAAKQVKKPMTFVPIMPRKGMRLGDREDYPATPSEMADKYIEFMDMLNARRNVRSQEKKVSVEEKVSSSYAHVKEKQAFISVDGLVLQVGEIVAAPYLPGFVLVHQDDPLALYCIGNHWYTPDKGQKSLEVLAEYFAKQLTDKSTAYDKRFEWADKPHKHEPNPNYIVTGWDENGKTVPMPKDELDTPEQGQENTEVQQSPMPSGAVSQTRYALRKDGSYYELVEEEALP